MSEARPDDARLVRRAAFVIALQTAAAVAVVVAGVALLVLALTVREQHADAERIVRNAAIAGSSAQPGVSIVVRSPDGTVTASPGTPQGLLGLDLSTLPTGRSEVRLPHADHDRDSDAEFLLYTVDSDGTRRIAALDTRYRASETTRLVTSLVIAGILGIAAAAVLGWIIGKRAVRPLGTALALQRRFVADASHELRTPLTILHTRAQILARRAGPDLDERTRRDLDQLQDDTRTLADIVNDMLLSAEMAHRPEARTPVDLITLATEVAASFAASAEASEIALSVQVPTTGPAIVAGAPVALRRAISSLVDNALAHTHPGDTIMLRVVREESTIRLSVIDTGEGLDPAETAALTERFARGTQASGRGRRFGLGLALVREIVQAHGGTLSLSGQVGQGAQAVITLPAT
jgi:signal transduction histidine kinase